MIPLEPDRFYHVFNRANGNEKIFLSDENFHFFLRKYELYISKFVHTYAYCLMPNHFHLLLSIKEEKEILNVLNQDKNLQGFQGKSKANKNPPGFENLEGFNESDKIEKLISFQFSRFLNSYAKAFNKQQKRKGSLFMKSYKRKLITDEKYLKKLVHYIHNNPIKAGLCDLPEKWKYSSYSQIVERSSTLLDTETVIDWFNDLENFKYFHKLTSDLTEVE
ncbi:MAG: transposase [Flavobacteriales bacterium]